MRTSKIYQAYNKITGKSYIGQTIKSLKDRKYQHYYDAKKLNKYYFHKALNKYKVEDWVWSILEKGIPVEDSNDKEIFYIAKHETYGSGGYNSTAGGGGLTGTARTYKLYHEDHGWVERTMLEFSEEFGVNKGQLNQMILGKKRQAMGWCLSPEAGNAPRKKSKKRIMLNPLKSKINSFRYTIYTIMYKREKHLGTKVSLAKKFNVSIERIRQITAELYVTKFSYLIRKEDKEKFFLLKPFRKKNINYYRHYKNLYDCGEIFF